MSLFGRKKKESDAPQATGSVTLEDGSSYLVAQTVDCIGDSCPRPQLMTKKALSNAQPGAVIEVKIDNPTSMEAIPPLMPELHGTHLATLKADRHWRIILRKD